MSVATDHRVDVRPYSGFRDPSLPIASWIAQGGSVGDATGGNNTMRFLFQRDDDAQHSEMFNWEQCSIDTTSPIAQSGTMRTENMDRLSQNRNASPQVWGIELSFHAGPFPTTMSLQFKLDLPLWLGAPHLEEGSSGLRLVLPNVDLQLYAVTLQGYMWGPRSVMAEGGPRRPVGGLFKG